jgi:two-component system sensor histidine kinase CreC
MPPNRFYSLRSRLYTLLLIVTIGTLAIGAAVGIVGMRPRYLAAVELSLYETSSLMAALVEQRTDRLFAFTDSMAAALKIMAERRRGPEIEGLTRSPERVRIYVCDRHGTVFWDSYEKARGQDYSRWRDVAATLRGEYGARASRNDPFSPGELWLYAASPIRAKVDSVILGSVSVGRHPAAMAALFGNAVNRLIVTWVIIAIALAWLLMWIVPWYAKPIEKLTAFANAVAEGENAHLPRVKGRVAVGSSEFDTLGQSLEKMRDGLEARAYVERYIENLVHSLKGPVSGIMSSLKLIRAGSVSAERGRQWADDIERKIALVNRAMDELMDQVKLENRAILPRRDRVSVGQLFTDAVHIRTADAELKGVDLRADAADDLFLAGDYSLLLKAINNLVENALDFTLAGGSVRLRAQRQGASWVRIVVEDTGVGIPAESLGRIYEKFYSLPRPDTNKASSGLGLGFVKELARLYEGEIEVKNRADAEHGVRAALSLPIGIEHG